MTIALIAHDAKKELMVQFCIAYCGILSRYYLVATGATGKTVSEATGLNIVKFLGGSQGGAQQIASRIGCDEIDLLLMFRDPLNPKPNEPDERALWQKLTAPLRARAMFYRQTAINGSSLRVKCLKPPAFTALTR